jgi:hypothetical protein
MQFALLLLIGSVLFSLLLMEHNDVAADDAQWIAVSAAADAA